MGLPGTGLFYTTKLFDGGSRVEHSAGEVSESPEERLTLGFFQRLATPDDEKVLVDGCRELVLGDEDKAFEHLEQAVHLADGAYLAGVMALKRGLWEKGIEYLSAAAENHHNLGRYFDKYGISATSRLAITHEVVAQVGPNLHGVLLALVETYQRLERWEDAIACLERLLQLEPEDVVVKLSLAELLLQARPGDKTNRQDSRFGRAGGTPEGREPRMASVNVCRKVVRLAEGIENETPVHTALLLYKAKALHGLSSPGRGAGDPDGCPAPEERLLRGAAPGAPVRTGPGLRGPRPAPAGAQRAREALRRGSGLRGCGGPVGTVAEIRINAVSAPSGMCRSLKRCCVSIC